MRAAPPPLFLALETEDFPAQAISAWDGKYRDMAFVVVDQDADSHKTFVIGASQKARGLGAWPGMPMAVMVCTS